MSVKELRKRLGDLMEQTKTLTAEIETGDMEEDVATEKMTKLEELTKACDATAEKLEKAVETAKKDARLASLLETSGSVEQVQVPKGATFAAVSEKDMGQKVHAEAGGVKSVDEAESIAMAKFLTNKPLSGQEMDLLAPRNQKLMAATRNMTAGVRIPTKAFAKMIGAKALPMQSDDNLAAGGRSYLHWAEYDDQIRILPPENPSFFDRVTKRAVSGNQLIVPVADPDTNQFSSVAVSRATEGSAANTTEAEFTQKTITCYPINAMTRVTNIMLSRDKVGLEQFVIDMFGGAFRRTINNEIANGTGDTGSQCLGIRQDDDVNTQARETASQVSWTDLVNLFHKLRPEVRMNASYAIADTVLSYLTKLTVSSDGTTDQRPLFSATTGAGPHDRLNNKPWFVGTDMSTLGGAGDVIFADFSQYWLAIEDEAVISRSEHRYFDSDETAYRITGLVGGKMLHPTAAAVLVGTSGS